MVVGSGVNNLWVWVCVWVDFCKHGVMRLILKGSIGEMLKKFVVGVLTRTMMVRSYRLGCKRGMIRVNEGCCFLL